MKRKIRLIERIDQSVIKRRGDDLMLMLMLPKISGATNILPIGSKVRMHRVEGGFFIEIANKKKSHDLTGKQLPRYEPDGDQSTQ